MSAPTDNRPDPFASPVPPMLRQGWEAALGALHALMGRPVHFTVGIGGVCRHGGVKGFACCGALATLRRVDDADDGVVWIEAGEFTVRVALATLEGVSVVWTGAGDVESVAIVFNGAAVLIEPESDTEGGDEDPEHVPPVPDDELEPNGDISY